jgi:methylthioribose-1-phosphate isomerase
MNKVEPLVWKNNTLILIDQRELPGKEIFHDIKTLKETHEAINVMIVRGAPLIGFTALFGMVLWLKNHPHFQQQELKDAGSFLKTARPTAVNLAYEVDRLILKVEEFLEKNDQGPALFEFAENFAKAQMEKLYQDNLSMAKLAAIELEDKFGDRKLNLMTLCNTGFLACGPMGTALGAIEYYHSLGRVSHVYASETRPYLQGGRLTAYELSVSQIPHSVTVEGAFSYLMREKLVDAIFIGADRIVSNGDTANKVGSSTLAIVAKHYGVPFYVVAPTSSFDLSSGTGYEIDIELRPEEEVLGAMGMRICPEKSKALNPSFDVTSSSLIEGIFCEKGLIKDYDPKNVHKIVKGE